MKVVIATDSFKGTLSSRQAGRAIAGGIRRVLPHTGIVVIPVADGGEGTAEALLSALGGRWETATVSGPLGAPVEARFAILADANRAVIEMAAASGLTLLRPDEYDPLRTTTYGTGELITAALDQGCRELSIGVGGSATVDGGCGAAQALGVRFLAADGKELPAGLGGRGLDRIAHLDLTRRDPRIAENTIRVLCDVTNPLCGPAGAARVFGPQKGASAPQVRLLDENLAHLAGVIRQDLGIDVCDVPGSGASGGLGAGLMAFLGARLVSGIEAVLDAVNLNEHLANADLLVTGEGRLDAQSMMGKVVAGVAARAKAAGVPVIAIAGTIAPDAGAGLELLQASYAVAESTTGELPTADEAARQLTHRTAEVFAQRYAAGP
jgi:glycerate kinase